MTGDAELFAFRTRFRSWPTATDTGESFGLVIAEAYGRCLPVVTHPAAGLRDNAQCELVVHGRTGFVATSVEEYARAWSGC